MGMYAEILAIGPFSQDIIKYLEYPADFYKNTKKGVPIVIHLFGIAEGSSISREFASYLGVSDPWDFNEHKLDYGNFNIEGLREFVEIYDEYSNDLDALIEFSKHGFEFYFLPNG